MEKQIIEVLNQKRFTVLNKTAEGLKKKPNDEPLTSSDFKDLDDFDNFVHRFFGLVFNDGELTYKPI